MTNPLEDIENRQGNMDLGRMSVQIFAGARVEANSWSEAFWATVAYWTAMFKQANEPEDENESS